MADIVSGANLIIKGDQQQGSVYLGSMGIARNQKALRENNIKAVLSILATHQITYTQGIVHLKLILKLFDQSFDFIQQQRKRTNVVLHCMAGISRSATLMIAYLMRKNRMKLQQARTYVKTKRNIIHPNIGFINQLKQFEKKLEL